MTNVGTLPVHRAGLPIRRIRVEVSSGPDAGKTCVGEERISVGTAAGNELVLSDPSVSRFHLDLERQADRITVIDHGSTNGTHVGAARVEGGRVQVPAGTRLLVGRTELLVDDAPAVLLEAGPDCLGELRGRSPAMRRLMATIQRVAAADVSVVVLGESGTGKELIGRALHDASRRSEGPFVTVDCGALSPTLFASELFGHERGAFTGADRRHVGAFERAQGGTVFLDEVGELPPDLQVALLGVLERGRVRRVGGSADIPVDVRVVSATHRDLRSEVNAGTFRLDLYYRLAVVLLTVPPLRERREDIPLLINHFLDQAGRPTELNTLFPAPALERLQRHVWPGNVRELRNVVLGTIALGTSPELGGPTGPATYSTAPTVPDELLLQPYREARAVVVEEFEKRYLTALLQRTDHNVRQASRESRMNRSYLIELLKRHGIH